MGFAFEVLTGFVTAPSTTLTALTMASGDSLTVRHTRPGTKAYILNLWTDNQTAGDIRLTAPTLHDNVNGIRSTAFAGQVFPLMPMGFKETVFPQDLLTVVLSGSGTAGDIETAVLLMMYQDLLGIDQRLISKDEYMRRLVNHCTVQNTLALGTSGGYSGSEAITAEIDQLKANIDYAILGYSVDSDCAVIGYSGTELGNLRVGGPGDSSRPDFTANWFVRLSEAYGMPMIPVFNSANKSNLLVDGATDENGTDVKVTTWLAELKTGGLN